MVDATNSPVTPTESDQLRIVLVQCTGSKRNGTHPARTLYDESDYFKKQRSYAKAFGDRWFIQSALYGLVHPDEVIESYDKHAKNLDDPKAWAEEIANDLSSEVPSGGVVEILGGKDYAYPLRPELESRGFAVKEPTKGEFIGKRRQSLARMMNTSLREYV